MPWLRILQKCAAAGRHLETGQVLAVPNDLPVEVANALARMGRAEILDEPPEAKPRTRRAKAAESIVEAPDA